MRASRLLKNSAESPPRETNESTDRRSRKKRIGNWPHTKQNCRDDRSESFFSSLLGHINGSSAGRHMKISTILDQIDSGFIALPEFQRGYVWNREQVRGLFDSMYRRHPVGGLLVWATEARTAAHRGDGSITAGIVKLLLDGQQRMTSLYGVVRGESRPSSSTATRKPSRGCASTSRPRPSPSTSRSGCGTIPCGST